MHHGEREEVLDRERAEVLHGDRHCQREEVRHCQRGEVRHCQREEVREGQPAEVRHRRGEAVQECPGSGPCFDTNKNYFKYFFQCFTNICQLAVLHTLKKNLAATKD